MNPDALPAFALLGLEPRPWQEADTVRQAYQLRARSLHPDADDGDAERFRELGAAYAQIRSVAARLRLLAAESTLPPPAVTDADLFMKIGAALQTCRTLGAPKTALERALQQVRRSKALADLGALKAVVIDRLATNESNLRGLDDRWPDVTAEELLGLATGFERLESWKKQVAEAEMNLR